MLKLIYFIGSVIQFFTTYKSHPHHIGITDIEYVSSKNELQVACKWFVDDLEDALMAYSGARIDVVKNAANICEDSILQNYISNHMHILIDNKKVVMDCMGAEFEKGALWVYWKIKDVQPYKSLSFHNNLFCEVHTDQIHFVHYRKTEKRETKKLGCNNYEVLFQ